ncbi:DEAD/DEAH box helicase [Streptomyces sp. WI04-05B]|uniref:DEAD/DEAH box helicase n=1 Tax=Streptomyces TaxID=1883 RepID=UPI0029B05E32|nr:MULTISPECIES: DEAD/DEAH box helicase [unclassified Streptomyces]MDX2542155.1 DEAD/DEAH box helicase [Streptomyces sp. WI04-05B]MDX2583987.1 DEAD/DEAH box helicase [Streptomyces sp. WI04-05A]
MTLPVALTGTDVIGQAKTGTGKTLGFGLPLLERVTVPADVEAGRAKPEQLTEAPQALVVVPTRELCQQVTNDLLTAGKVRNVRVLAIYGGRAYEPQVEALKKGVDVIVGTPGRLLDLAGQKKLDLSHVRALVLDEADEMLDLGFLPDVEKIMNMLPARRQTMLFSATMPGAVIGLARRYMSQPTHIRAAAPDDEGKTVANTAQYVYRAHNMDKPELVARILQADGRGLAMVFCRTKRTAADLADQLAQRGFASGAVHGDLGQGAREQALRAFRNGKVDVLVCTDVAARGIDVEGVTHVINYQSPEEEKTYLHRIGRTGRAGAKGIAITLVDWDDIPRWQLINKALELNFNDPPETYSTSPHLFEELSIPAGTKGVLPRSERTRAGLGAEELEDLGETGGRGGPRGRGGRGGHSSGPAAASAPPAERERPARTPRSRRRTRGGAASDAPTTPTASAAPVTSAGDALAPSEQPTERRTPRRRRRTRGAAAESVPAPTTTFVEPSAEAAVATAEGTAPATEQPRRRRTRRTAESAPTTPVEVNPVATPVVPEAETPEEQPHRRRTRRTAELAPTTPVEVTPVATPAVPEAETPEEQPRRRRTRKAAEPVVGAPEVEVVAETKARRAPRKTVAATATAEAAVDTAEGVEAKPRRTATRKATAPAAEAAVDTAETVEAKPRRRTARKAAEPVAAVVEATPVTPEPEATKPRRTRKAAAATAPAAEAALDTAEAVEAKPRRRATRKAAEPAVVAETVDIPAQPTSAETPEPKRRTTRKATAPAAEAAVDTAEGVEAKPRRRTARKTAEAPAVTEPELTEPKPRRTARKATATAAQAAVDTAEATEAKPRRTTARKATATAPAAEAAVDTAEGVEAKPRRRTARKAVEVVADIPAQVADDAEAKPRRRARKAAEPVVVVETAPEAAEAKPRRRATRKATVSAPTTDAVEA